MLELDATAIAQRLQRPALIDALEAAFRAPHRAPARQQYALDRPQSNAPGGTLLVMPAWNARVCGIKIVTVFPDNAARGLPAVAATYLLIDATDGRPLALLDGGELTARRTAAASALAARQLAHPEASRMLMVGTGRLAPHLIESHACVRPLREVRIWGRRPERARSLAARLAPSGLRIEAVEDLESAVRWADLISCATLSHAPLVLGGWLRPGQHLDLVGAFTPQMCEADDAALARAEIYVDTREGALAEAGELIGAMQRGVLDAGAIRAELAEIGSGRFRRSAPDSITLFKSVGAALEDLTAAQLAVRSAC
ncbi:MAG TPA: ornithine cyclodeaminase family protein [Steroidobacteraceae bacterium]|nr:ornithine cyclodeaminase family protein [Steroidobacteraceae bacterium]